VKRLTSLQTLPLPENLWKADLFDVNASHYLRIFLVSWFLVSWFLLSSSWFLLSWFLVSNIMPSLHHDDDDRATERTSQILIHVQILAGLPIRKSWEIRCQKAE
jgi:hypothetical protein